MDMYYIPIQDMLNLSFLKNFLIFFPEIPGIFILGVILSSYIMFRNPWLSLFSAGLASIVLTFLIGSYAWFTDVYNLTLISLSLAAIITIELIKD